MGETAVVGKEVVEMGEAGAVEEGWAEEAAAAVDWVEVAEMEAAAMAEAWVVERMVGGMAMAVATVATVATEEVEMGRQGQVSSLRRKRQGSSFPPQQLHLRTNLMPSRLDSCW